VTSAGAHTTVASGSYAVPAGTSATVAIKLDAEGLRIMAARYQLQGTLALNGTTAITRPIKLSYARIHSPVAYTWFFTPLYSVAKELSVSSLPTGGRVQLLCTGPGCGGVSLTARVSKRTMSLLRALHGERLRPHATLEVIISAPNSIDRVVRFTVRAGAPPAFALLCRPPGARGPSRCA
jgi:hypothetical protein